MSTEAEQSVIPEIIPSVLGLCSVGAGGLLGLEFQKITVEVSSRRGPSYFQLAGLAETAVREARVRIHSALSGLGITLDEYALTVNLAPANVRKSGSGLDLAIAIAILGAIGEIDVPKDALFLGELSLDGGLRPIPGMLPLLVGAKAAKMERAFIPVHNAAEAAHVDGFPAHAASRLTDVIAHLKGDALLPCVPKAEYRPYRNTDLDLADVRGQEAAKRALVVASAGHHHLLLVGPPGAGKSLLARRLVGLLPPLSPSEALESTSIHSVAGLVPSAGVLGAPPFRAPHHTVSDAGLVGGGSTPRPGEISLAHHGVLFLDELPEFRRNALEALRQPLEELRVQIVRATARTSFPARPLLVGAMNPCPCGNWGNPRAVCRCPKKARLKYLSKISGPLLDRIDLHVVVPPVDLHSWSDRETSPVQLSTADAAALVDRARARQAERFHKHLTTVPQNSLLDLEELERIAAPSPDGKKLLGAAIEKNLLSARGYVRVLRVARTLADLSDADAPTAPHIAEALRYRLTDLASL